MFNKKSIFLLFFISFNISIHAQTNGTLTITTTTASPPSLVKATPNVCAFWIEDSSGNLINTMRYNSSNSNSDAAELVEWMARIGSWGKRDLQTNVDVTTGATLSGYGVPRTAFWGKTTSLATIPDGVYNVKLEIANGLAGVGVCGYAIDTYSFTKGPNTTSALLVSSKNHKITDPNTGAFLESSPSNCFLNTTINWAPVPSSNSDIQAPTVPLTLQNSLTTSNSFTLSWGASTDNVAVSGYDVYKNGLFYALITGSTSTSITGLTSATAYSMTVKARDAAGNVSPSSVALVVTTADDIAPIAPTILLNTIPTANSFTLSWSGATDNVGVIGYDVYKNGVFYGSSTSTSLLINGLTSAFSYSMTVKAKDAAGNVSTTSNPLLLTTADNVVPSAPTNLQNSIPTANSFTLSWTASTDNLAVTGYDVYKDGILYGSTINNSLLISGLPANTSFSMTVKAKDAAGNSSILSTGLIVLTTILDTQAPTVPSGMVSTAITDNSFTVIWSSSTDNVTVTGYDVYKDGVLYGASSSVSLPITGLAPNTTYSITIKARDAAGNTSAPSTVIIVKTLPDIQAPTAPSNLQVSSIKSTSFTLNWTGSTDNIGVVGYDVYTGVIPFGSTAATTLTLNGLMPNSNYRITVRAKDAVGNLSAESTVLMVTTLPAPAIPSGLTTTVPTENSFTLIWNAVPNVVGYDIYKNGLFYATTSNTVLPITGLNYGMLHSMTVVAKDLAGSTSDYSVPLLVYTRYNLPIEIGMVGVSSDNKNMVVWNKPLTIGVASFSIYKESNVSNIYNKIGVVSYDSLSVFVDTQSAPDVQSNKYKISIIDRNSLETNQSSSHKTMHLSINKGMGAAWNLSWEPYEGFVVSTYNIYRGTTANNLTLIGSTSGSSTQYNDFTAPAGNIYYQLEVVSPNSVNPTKVMGVIQKTEAFQNNATQSYGTSRSNIATNAPTVLHLTDEVSFDVYPNPSNGLVTLSLANASGYSVMVSNTLGQKVYTTKLLTEKTNLDFSQFGKQGIYFVQITDEKGSVVGWKKVVVQ